MCVRRLHNKAGAIYITIIRVCNRLVNHRSLLPEEESTSSQALLRSVPKPFQSSMFLNDSDGAIGTLVKLEAYSNLREVVSTPGHFPGFKRLLRN